MTQGELDPEQFLTNLINKRREHWQTAQKDTSAFPAIHCGPGKVANIITDRDLIGLFVLHLNPGTVQQSISTAIINCDNLTLDKAKKFCKDHCKLAEHAENLVPA